MKYHQTDFLSNVWQNLQMKDIDWAQNVINPFYYEKEKTYLV